MNQHKSWRWVICAYGGVAVLIATITLFIVRAASHSNVVLTNGASTPTPTVVDVFHGIRPDPASPWIHAKAAAKVAVAASPTPGSSPSPGASASPSPAPKTVAVVKQPALKHRKGKATASTGTAVLADAAAAGSGVEPPAIEHPAPATDAPAAPTAAPAAPTAAPVVATAAPQPADDNAPIYAPERVVDAQVRVAVQPDFPDVDRERGEHGTSIVLVTIDPKGNVVKAAVGSSSGYPGLDRAAISAARASQFVAPRINGHPATETYRVVYDFSQ